jgi:transcriptional regulator with XRE-family HTH domain
MLTAIGEALRNARLEAGLSQRELGSLVGISHSQISRIERGLLRHVPYETIAILGATLGLDVPLRAFPNGDPVRDAGQLALLKRFRALLPASLRHRTEVPIGPPGDLRAWDDVIDAPGWTLPVEAESRIHDVQALQRKLTLKCRDGGVDRMLLVVADTRHNRHVLRLAADDFGAAFPLRGREALGELRAGRRPSSSAIVLL